LGLLVPIGAFTVLHALFVAAWARGHAPMPALAVAGYAGAALIGSVAVVGLWRRAPWLRVVALPWGGVAAWLAVLRALESTAGAPFRYATAVALPLLYLWLAREMIAAARTLVPPPARPGT
jgi:hypothetical protein